MTEVLRNFSMTDNLMTGDKIFATTPNLMTKKFMTTEKLMTEDTNFAASTNFTMTPRRKILR